MPSLPVTYRTAHGLKTLFVTERQWRRFLDYSCSLRVWERFSRRVNQPPAVRRQRGVE